MDSRLRRRRGPRPGPGRRGDGSQSAVSFVRFVAASLALHAALLVPAGLLYLLLHRDETPVETTTISEAELTPAQQAELPPLDQLPAETPKTSTAPTQTATAVPKPVVPKAVAPTPVIPPPITPTTPPPALQPKPPEPQVAKRPPPKPTARQKMVEQDYDKDDKPVPDAKYLAEHSRRVEKETRATDTNLQREQRGEQAPSAPKEQAKSAASETNPGGERERIAELRDTPGAVGKRPGAAGPASPTPPRSAPPAPAGGGGAPSSGKLSMRSPVPPGAVTLDRMAPGEGIASPEQTGGAPSTRPPTGSVGPGTGPGTARLQLDYRDYDRAFGETADRERRLGSDSDAGANGGGGREQSSWRKGRWAARQAAMRSALENFIPEVRPGNQTALNTRAYPFARYINEMHRSIHKLWGFGFLQDLDNKPSSNPMNNRSLATTVEVVLLADGRVDRVTIARPSGNLTFDIAATDVVMAASPYPAPPEAIRSKNGKVYLHWQFHRDERQCATSGVEPFILDNPPPDKGGTLGAIGLPSGARGPAGGARPVGDGKSSTPRPSPFGPTTKEELGRP